jgi:nucleoside-diphosphate-sugar epimerase
MKALLIGGTGPTGPIIAQGLLARGYATTVLHRGGHELDLGSSIEHIHADPHFLEPLEAGLEGRTFDVVVATYGRLRYLPEVLRNRTDRLISIGGTTYESRLSAPSGEDQPRVIERSFYWRILETEDLLAQAHEHGVFNWTHLRYPRLYGPRQLAPWEWGIIRRILDGRRRLIVADAGLMLLSRAYVENAAHGVLLALDHAGVSVGQTYNVADSFQPSDADRIREIAKILGEEVELVSCPGEVGVPAYIPGLSRALRSGTGQPLPGHEIISIEKICRDLGYTDVVGFSEAMRRTVNWYLENPPAPGGEEEQKILDPFNYPLEDSVLAASDQLRDRIHELLPDHATRVHQHPYPHPKVQP